MEDLLILILQCLFELVLDIILNLPIDCLPSPFNVPARYETPTWISVVLFIVGCCIGVLSLLAYRHSIIDSSFMRMASLAYAPSLCGWIAYKTSHARGIESCKRRGWYAFFFTFGLTLVRFTYAQR